MLRWFGYFRERVTDGAGEVGLRVRRVVVHYYQEDDSLDVSEPRQDNSGLMQVLYSAPPPPPPSSPAYVVRRYSAICCWFSKTESAECCRSQWPASTSWSDHAMVLTWKETAYLRNQYDTMCALSLLDTSGSAYQKLPFVQTERKPNEPRALLQHLNRYRR